MNTEIQPEKVNLQNPQEIIDVIDFYIHNGHYNDAAVLFQRLSNISQEKNSTFLNESKRVIEKVVNAAASLGWYILDRVTPEQLVVLFQDHLEYAFEYPWEFTQKQVEIILKRFDDLTQRDAIKQQLRDAIQYSTVSIGKKKISVNGRIVSPTIQNWLYDYDVFAKGKNAYDPLTVVEYLNTAQNSSQLISGDREKIETVLRLYSAMSLSSLSAQGNEDVIVYHDIESGHVKYIDHGKEIDTGVVSDLVAAMTPEEKKEAMRDIRQRLADSDAAAVEGGLVTTPILVQQIAGNEDLKRAIMNDAALRPEQKKTETTVVPPRITPPQQPVTPVATKKVEPIQAVMPTPPQPVSVSVAPKPRIAPIPAPVLVPAPMPVMPTVAPTPEPAPVPQVPVAPKPMPEALVIPKPTPVVAPVQAPAPVPKKQTEGIDYASLAELVLAEHALLLASVEAENRFLSLIAAFAKGERTRDEVITTLTMPIESGGVNITADIAASCLNTAERFTQGAQLRNRRRPQAVGLTKKAQPTFQQVTDMMQRHKAFEDTRTAEKQSLTDAQQPTPANFLSTAPTPSPVTATPRTGVEDIFANLDVAQMQQKSVAPETNSPIRRIDSIRTQQPRTNGKQQLEQVMGPMQELQKFAIADLRSFGKNPETATAFIKEKIDLQTQESISKRAEAIRAWQESPLHQLYVQIGNASLTQGMPVNQYIQQRQQTGDETLTTAEFEAIASLNRQLRF